MTNPETQTFQNPLIKEYTVNKSRIHNMISGIWTPKTPNRNIEAEVLRVPMFKYRDTPNPQTQKFRVYDWGL